MTGLPCDCCVGARVLTPQDEGNRPGLAKLSYRVGTYATFFDSMRARLSSGAFFDDVRRRLGHEGPLGLAGLTTREPDDFTIGLLDAWAVAADVLAFYQERIANEGYLRCATERRSVLELARLVGYVPRPGVAASVYLAYALEKDAAPVQIPKGARVNSVPAPGEQMQAFETAEPLAARVEWNELAPRTRRPLRLLPDNASFVERIRFKGTTTGLAKNDVLLFTFGRGAGQQLMRRVSAVMPDNAAGETEVTLQLPSEGRPILLAWSDASDRYSDLEAHCLPTDDPLLNAVSASLVALRDAIDAFLRNPPGLDVARSSKTAARQYSDIEKKYELFKVAAKAALKPGDREVRAWLTGYYMEMSRYLGMGLLGERELLDRFAEEFGLSGGIRILSQGQAAGLVPALVRPQLLQPANSQRLERVPQALYALKSDLGMRLLASLRPALAGDLYQAWRNTPAAKPEAAEVFVLRVRAQLFGHNAPKRMHVENGDVTSRGDWPVVVSNGATHGVVAREDEHAVHLDAAYDQILPNSWLVVSTPPTRLTYQATQFFLASNPNSTLSRAEYGMTGKTTRIELRVPGSMVDGSWFNMPSTPSTPQEYSDDFEDFNAIRKSVVYAASEKLELADMPIGDDVCGSRIEVAGLYDGLEAGRWLIVTGERTDIKDELGKPVTGVVASELVMLGGVTQDVVQVKAPPPVARATAPRIRDVFLTHALAGQRKARAATVPREGEGKGDDSVVLAGDSVHTHLALATGLAYKYKRDTVKIRANVVRATHGETRQEVLGSGDATQAFQSFTLKQHPLTYVSAATPAGLASTLSVRVNGVEWHETASLAGLGPRERSFVTRTSDDGSTSVVFGNGQSGARLPGGIENVRAEYRYGIGRPGNVKAGQVSLLATRPLGVKGVVNPLPATGGADRETRDQARKNLPLAVTALDRLVSVQDHADFARTFAGVGKAVARERSDGRRPVVHLTIAGVDDIPIAADSDLLRNLRAALHLYGDPVLPIRLQVRERLALVVSASVRLAPDYSWEATEPLLRQAMLAAFGFDNLELGRDLYASAAIAVLQAVPGVAWVDLDVFDVISEQALLDGFDKTQALQLMRQERIVVSCGELRGASLVPAQIAYLAPEVPDTLILKEAST